MNNTSPSDSGKQKFKIKDFLLRYTMTTLGCIIYSLGVALFLDANRLASGGVTGIAIVLNHIIDSTTGFNFDTGLIILIINLPLFVLGFISFGKKFILSTVYSTALSSLLIWLCNFVFEKYLPVTDSLLLASLIGGALFGLGLGLIFRMGSSTGGTDIIVKMLRKKFRNVKTGVISMTIDIAIIAFSAIVFKNFELACYTVISIIVFTFAFDCVLYGGNSAKLVYIISPQDKAEIICGKILKDLDIGATYVDGKGAYTQNDKRIILCAIKNLFYPRLRDLVREVDPNAFMIVTSAKEIYGEGYKDHFDEEL